MRTGVIVLLAAVVASSCGTDDRPIPNHPDHLRAEVEAARPPDYAMRDKDTRDLWTRTQDSYRARNFAPVWLDEGRPTPTMAALIDAVTHADGDGLDPALYDVALPTEANGKPRKRFSEEEAAEIDARLTFAYLQLASDLAQGASDVTQSQPNWHVRPRTFDAAAHLTTALADGTIAESLASLRPHNQEYRALAALLADYRQRPHDAQDSDGVSIAERIQQIELNMERWRWLPRDADARRIVVNIPAFRLDVWEGDNVALSMRVVVGKKTTPTPVFTDAMTHVVFSPYWNVPATIVKGETLPAVMRDPSFLERTNMEVLDGKGQVVDPASIDPARAGAYRFRQRPGGSNALGLVKFMFPNEFDVYLHDTPADALFARASRPFSHGCVRLEQPQALAEYVLKDRAEWTPETIAAAMHAGEERTVKLREKLPVYIGYWTVDVTPDGKTAFMKDVYGLDAPQVAALQQRRAHAQQPVQLASRED